MVENQTFDYSKLRGRIVEKFGLLSSFARAMGCSDGTLSSKLAGKTFFNAEEIVKACRLLGVGLEEVSDYFFTLRV